MSDTQLALTRDESSSLVVLEATIEKGLGTFYDVGAALLTIRDRKLFRADFDTFEDYCQERWELEERRAYQLMDSAKVVDNLKTSSSGGTLLPTSEWQTRPLTQLPPEKQAEAWGEAVEKVPKGKKPSGSIIEKIVTRLLGKKSTTRRTKEGEDGWSQAQVEADPDLAKALFTIEKAYGKEDRKAIQNGTIGLSRKEIVTLSKLSTPKMQEVQHLLLANHWKLDKALKFVGQQPDDDSTVAELKNYCLTTKGLYWTGTFNGFDISVKATAAVKRK